ncbi:hypothetical protein [Breznakiella homolactica]|uniref:Uncharacterized protein n=1 Tax=Breznakiella homolactica TaxID=2798577 RepID=A0A7T8B9P5_9SPIR|nr:hypothetical protein [Breznakiella homolactica]QQO08687.1 hypothetical protein JFL75_17420 [Breznakiella homolactica]
MKELLKNKAYAFISPADRDFILAFDREMERLGYGSGGTIGGGYCWGRYMIIYTKTGVKSKKSYARMYIRDGDLVLRMYFSDVDSRREAVEAAPEYIREGFTGDYGRCGHCHNQREDGTCGHRKSYTISGKLCEFCDGFAFWFFNPDVSRLPEYIKIFTAFYPEKKPSPGPAGGR